MFINSANHLFSLAKKLRKILNFIFFSIPSLRIAKILSVGNEKPQRRGSVGSLDSGMSISFQSTSASTGSRSDTKTRLFQQQHQQQQLPQPHHAILGAVNSGITPMIISGGVNVAAGIGGQPSAQIAGGTAAVATGVGQHPSFLGGIFNKRERKLSKSDEGSSNSGRSTEV